MPVIRIYFRNSIFNLYLVTQETAGKSQRVKYKIRQNRISTIKLNGPPKISLA